MRPPRRLTLRETHGATPTANEAAWADEMSARLLAFLGRRLADVDQRLADLERRRCQIK